MKIGFMFGDGLELAVEQISRSNAVRIVFSKGRTPMETFWEGKKYFVEKDLSETLAV